ncbi:HlyIII-domain-containing protein [Tuber magnatum]|uniref:HlyIII-domain-containing protein n=1 Tax=Tuber magnatum TaxID=42249 RepID=A0A317SS05_9PEZI|nr:HlyIII-domain-containing protein [Tuber magnatum]
MASFAAAGSSTGTVTDSWKTFGSPKVTYRKGRRHSSHHVRSRNFSTDLLEDDSILLLKVDLFLSELERRLDYLEEYGNIKLDEGIQRAYHTLQAVREGCGRVGGEVIGEGKRRARVIVEVLESSYHEVIEAKETLPAKVHAGVRFLEELLAEFETCSHASMDRKLDQAMRGVEAVIDAKDKLADSIERAIKAARERRLITYEELPFPWRVNPYITRGYRFTETKLECVLSVFALNNETCNIWTHGLGFILILAIAFYFYPMSQIFNYHTTADKFINGLFFLAAAKALACSTIWHTFSSISHQTTMERFACVDYSGISMLIAASIITTEYTAFYVEPISRSIYITITFLFGVAGAILPWKPTFNRADMRVWRVVFYVTLGATGTIPMIQLSITRGLSWVALFYLSVLKSIAVYIAGAVIYAMQVPERFYPGCFDWIGGSHNIWHVCVLGGILFHWHAMHDLFHRAFEMATA